METEVVVVLASGKCRRHYSPDHTIFAAGNALRARTYQQHDGTALLQYEDVDEQQEESDVFQCRLFTCNVGFRSVAAYEEHYDLVHRNVCLECYRSFLSHRLLDMHISETHDAFFKVLSKRQPMYACLVDGCTEMFTHDDKRNRHLVQTHQYPPGFSLLAPRRNAKTPPRSHQDGAGSTTKNKTKQKQKRPRKKKPLAHAPDDAMDVDTMTSAAPSDQAPPPANQAAQDVDMVNALTASVRDLRIPKTLSFGRRQRNRQ